MQCASMRTISMITSADSTATSAIDGYNNSLSRSTTSSTAPNCQPTSRVDGPFSGAFVYGSKRSSCHSEWRSHRS